MQVLAVLVLVSNLAGLFLVYLNNVTMVLLSVNCRLSIMTTILTQALSILE